MNETIKVYEPLWLVKLFHSFPHLNMWFQQVNSTFNPLNMENNEYIEVNNCLIKFLPSSTINKFLNFF